MYHVLKNKNMNKLIIFDLDGVLYDSKEIHFESLNQALLEVDEKYIISLQDHLNIFDGLPTKTKLRMISDKKDLPEKLHEMIWLSKQEKTLALIKNIFNDDELIEIFSTLKNLNIKIACCSNSIKSTVIEVLKNLGVLQYIDFIQSNDDVTNPKPHPEMYWRAMLEFGVLPSETLIVEDSAVGRLGALESGANNYFVDSRKDLDVNFISNILNPKGRKQKLDTYKNDKLNVLIPLAGAGSRFAEKGYVFPKPLIEIKGKPMIEVVVKNLNIDANYIFIVQKEHVEKYNIDKMLNLIKGNSEVVVTEGLTEGAACTTLLAKEFIDNDNPLVISNSDQFILWNPREMMYNFTSKNFDGGILTFQSSHPKWSYAKTNDENIVTEVAEKNPISTNATVGVYYWKKGSDYVKYAEEMITEDIRVNNEFYVCPVYNQAIKDSKKITIGEIEKMWGIGTPEDLDSFLEDYKEL
jgi:HAD superfamily hydrolase (TIGR01509 family)